MSETRWRPPKKPKYEQVVLMLLAVLVAAAAALAYALLWRLLDILNS